MIKQRATAPRAWRWVAILTVAYAVSVIDRVGIGLLVAPIKRDLALSDTAIGTIQGLAFGIFYIGLALPIGRLVDRGDRRLILAAGVAVWTLGTLAGAAAHGAIGLFAARLLVGAGEATLTPASASLIGDLFPEKRRPLAFGVFTVGVGLGIGSAFAGIGMVLGHAGAIGLPIADWRLAFLAMAVPGILLAAVMVSMREPPRAFRSARPDIGIVALFDQVRTAPAAFAALILGAAMLQLIGTVMISWFPTVLIRSHGLTPQRIGAALGPIAIVVGIPSALLAGWLVARLSRADARRAPFVALGITMLAYPALSVAALLAPDAGSAIAAYAAGVLFSNFAIPVALSGVAVLTPPYLRGQMVALLMMTVGVISLGIGPALTGAIADTWFASLPRGIAFAGAIMTAVSALIGFSLLAYAARRFRDDRQRSGVKI